MTTRLLIFLAAVLLCWAAPAEAQTIKSLGYNTTNGQVAYTGTNTLTFTNALAFGTNAPATRTNLSLGATWLTNANVTNFRTAIGLGATNMVGFDSVQANDFTVTDGGTFSFEDTGSIEFGNAAGPTRTNLGLGLPALTNTSNVTAMRALAGSTNTNEPFSGSISVVGTNNTNTLVFSNGILLSQ
jgi:hypothetical protein